jgi:predicted aconitase with swiveling domain
MRDPALTMTRSARAYAVGVAEAIALVLRAPVSFWGGIDVKTGVIIDRGHPDAGTSVTGTVLVMPGARGSSSSSSVLAETMRMRTGPAAIVLAIADPILPVGALVAESLYGVQCPIVVCAIDGISTGDVLRVVADADGSAEVAVEGPLPSPDSEGA